MRFTFSVESNFGLSLVMLIDCLQSSAICSIQGILPRPIGTRAGVHSPTRRLFDTRLLPKEECEATKNLLRKIPAWQRGVLLGLTFSLALAAVTDTVVASWPAVKSIAATLEVHDRGAGGVPESAAVHMGTNEKGHAVVCVNGNA